MGLRSYRSVAAAVTLLALAVAPGARADDRADAAIVCLALTIYYEARGEPEAGKRAVGHVVMNRVRSSGFPADVCAVVQQGGERRHRCQFSWWCDGLSDRPRDRQALRQSLALAKAIYDGCVPDPTGGALWFHATSVNPAWSRSFGPGKKIGRHMFYRGAPELQAAVAAPVRWRTKPDLDRPAACAATPKPARNVFAASG